MVEWLKAKWLAFCLTSHMNERFYFILFFFNIFFLTIFAYLFIYLWLCWVFVSVRGLSPVAASGGHSSSRCTGPLTIVASLVAEHRLQMRRLSSCGSWAQLLRGMWDLPRPELEPVSPALAGRFSTTVPPGKPWKVLFLMWEHFVYSITFSEKKVFVFLFLFLHRFVFNFFTV